MCYSLGWRLFSYLAVYPLYENTLNALTEEDFYEWFRGLVDGEGCFSIKVSSRSSTISFSFQIYLHKDDTDMLKYIALKWVMCM